MKTSKTVAKILFVVGALVYLLGLWISCPLLSGKGYFLGVLMTATFGNYAYLRAEKLGQLDDFFTHICQLVALITIGLLFIGGFAPIFPDICYHLTHYKPAAADIPVASDNPAHYADAIRYNARTPLQGSLLPLTRLVWA